MTQQFRHVLVVDDCDITTKRVAKSLRAEGYLVTTASGGVEALESINKVCPDYVITDWEMPHINGQMLCQILRTEAFDKYMYLIIMTAHSDLLDLVDGLGAGADDYITKPIKMRELVARMKSGARILALDRRLNHAAEHDPLTGIMNRRKLMSTMTTKVSCCVAKKSPVTTIMIDIDHFKGINDTHGHQIGDEVLVRVANSLTERFRTTDYVCRYGGEEFAIILPDCDEPGAIVCAERCRQEIESLKFSSNKDVFGVTASFGVAQLRSAETPIQMIDRADRALIRAKMEGKNRVIGFDRDRVAEAIQAAKQPSVAK